MGVSCRPAEIVKAQKHKQGRKLVRGGATRAFLFLVFPTLLRLPHHLRAWNRLVDRRYIDLKEEPKAMYKEFRLVKGSRYVGDQQINRHDLGAQIGLH